MDTNSGNISVNSNLIRYATFEDEGVVQFTVKPITSIRYNATHYLYGIGVELLESLQFMLNFPAPHITFVDSYFETDQAHRLSEGAWNETVDDLLKSNRTDVVIGYLYLLPSRAEIANPLMPISNEMFEVYFLQPEFTQVWYNPFTKQLSTSFALALMGVLAISGVLLACFMSFIGPRSSSSSSIQTAKRDWRDFEWYRFWNNLYDTMFWAIGTGCQQGTDINASKWQAKLLIGLMANLCVLTYSMYCGLIVASLTRKTSPIQDTQHLFHFKYTFYAYPDTKSRFFIGNESDLFWNPPIPNNYTLEDDDLEEYKKTQSIRRIFTHRHAHLDTPDLFYPDLYHDGRISRKVCNILSVLPYRGGSLQSGFYARKEFKLRREFNYALSRIREVGVAGRQLKMYDSSRVQRCPSKRLYYQADLGMSYLGSTFLGLLVVYVIATCAFLVEYFYQRGTSPKNVKGFVYFVREVATTGV